MELNQQQEDIVKTYGGMICVSAAAGSGKSSTLVQHVDHLVRIDGENEKDIMVISFTRAAVDSLKKKFSALGLLDIPVHTFHSLSAKILNDSFIDVSKTIPVWKVENCFRKINSNADTENILSWIAFQKNSGRLQNDEFVYKESDYSEEDLRIFFKAYEELKSKENAYDFEDWILLALDELKKHPIKYKFVIADEVQDSNALNISMLKLISDKNLMVIGDARQSIYGFRGSKPEFFINFDKEFPNAQVMNLDINYRSAKNIVEKANKFIKPYFKNYSHYSDSISNNQEDGIITLISNTNAFEESIKLTDLIEKMIKNGADPNEISIIYRINSNSEFIEGELKKRKIPYDISNDSSFFKRKEIHGILSYLQLIENVHNDGAFIDTFNLRNHPLKFMAGSVLEDIRKKSGKDNKSMYETFIDFNFPKAWLKRSAAEFHDDITRLIMQKDKGLSIEELINNVVKIFGIEDYIREKYPNKEECSERIASIEVLKSFAKGTNLSNFLEYALSANLPKKKKDGVKLCSIHKAKGLEWDTVFLIGVEKGKFPFERSLIEEEARLWYVAVTRSKGNLYISQIGSGNQFVNEYFNN